MTNELLLKNDLYDRNISIDAARGLPPVIIQRRNSQTVDITLYMHDKIFLTRLADYIEKGDLTVFFENQKLEASQLRLLYSAGFSALTAGAVINRFTDLLDCPGSFERKGSSFIQVDPAEEKLIFFPYERMITRGMFETQLREAIKPLEEKTKRFYNELKELRATKTRLSQDYRFLLSRYKIFKILLIPYILIALGITGSCIVFVIRLFIKWLISLF